MTDDAAPVRLVRLELENQLAAGRAFLAGDPSLTTTYGTAMDTIAGLPASSCAVWDYPLFNRVLGAGIFGSLDDGGIDAVVRHYAARGRTACVETYRGVTSPELISALVQAGFTDSGHGYESHVLQTDRPPELVVPGIDVRRCEPAEYRRFGELVRDGFDMGGGGPLGAFFVDLSEVSLRVLGRDGAGFIASADGEDAGTGQLVLTDRVAGCYSGSVVERFRGRGIQKAVIAARVAEGFQRGRRIFISQTDPDSPSGHNLHDLGFRTLYRATWYTRPA